MLIVPQTLQCLVEGCIAGFGATQLFEPGAYFFRLTGLLIEFVTLDIGVELPDLFPHPIHRLLMAVIEWNESIDDALGMDPTQGVVENIELTGIVTHDHEIARDSPTVRP